MMQSTNYRKYFSLDKNTVESSRVQDAATRVNVRSPTIDENEIGTITRKRYNNVIHNGEITHYYKNQKLYIVSYENGENEKINQR